MHRIIKVIKVTTEDGEELPYTVNWCLQKIDETYMGSPIEEAAARDTKWYETSDGHRCERIDDDTFWIAKLKRKVKIKS